jgi:cell division protein ZapA
MKQRIEVEIYNQTFIVNSEDDERYVSKIAAYVDQRMRQMGESAKTAMPLRVAIMAALSIADDYYKALQRETDTQQEIERLSSLILDRIADNDASDDPMLTDKSLSAFATVGTGVSSEDDTKKEVSRPS